MRNFKLVLIFIALIWIVQIINFFMGYDLNSWFGLSTRRSSGIPGILFSPLLHGGFAHAAFNSAPLLVLGGIIIGINKRGFLPATGVIIIVGGFLTWLLARPNTLHVGASGVVFGYLGYLVAYGVRHRSPMAILGAIMASVMYGYLIKGVLPSGPGVSWEGHLFGLIAGILAALLLPEWKEKV